MPQRRTTTMIYYDTMTNKESNLKESTSGAFKTIQIEMQNAGVYFRTFFLYSLVVFVDEAMNHILLFDFLCGFFRYLVIRMDSRKMNNRPTLPAHARILVTATG